MGAAGSLRLTEDLVIAILCLVLNNKLVSPYGKNIKAITLLSSSIFPIIYAAILGKLLRRIALFKAERSSTIGVSQVLQDRKDIDWHFQTLEQLIGSQSFFASVEWQFRMRRVIFLSIVILVA
jgi:hypothetical protein